MTTGRDEIEEGENICANPACDCPITAGGDYCGDYCSSTALNPNREYVAERYQEHGAGCGCGHAECQI